MALYQSIHFYYAAQCAYFNNTEISDALERIFSEVLQPIFSQEAQLIFSQLAQLIFSQAT
jgi:hypothetical protein